MPRYVSFYRYTGEAWGSMVERPGNRAAAARKLIESVGGTMETFYWMLGDWDGLVIYEVPDAAAAAAFSARVAGSGMLDAVQTHQLVSMDEAKRALDTARGAAYVPPGAQQEWRAEYDVLGG